MTESKVWTSFWGKVAAFVLLTPMASAQVAFQETGPFMFPPNTAILHAEDIDSDQHADLIAHPHMTTQLVFALGDGLGGMSLQPIVLDTGLTLSSIATGDLDGDGDPDLIVASLGTQDVLQYQNTGGNFLLVQSFDAGALPQYVVIEDFNGDGIRDLVVARSAGPVNPPAVSLYVNNGAGFFAPPVHFPVGANPILVEAADLNGDSQPDLVVSAAGVILQDVGELSVLIANGPASFAPALSTGPMHPVHFAIGDLVGGTNLDVAVVDAFAAFGCGLTSGIWAGDGTGNLLSTQTIDFPCGPFAVRAADFDLDGSTDLLLTDGGDFIPAANFFQIAERNAQGTLDVGALTFGVGAYSLAPPVLADFDEDGLVDVAMAHFLDGLSIFINQSTPTALVFRRGDTNEDGSFNIADSVRLLNALFVSGSPPLTCPDSGDGNDDGSVNIADAVYLLAATFSGGPQPLPPFTDCGSDPTLDGLPDCVQQPGGCP